MKYQLRNDRDKSLSIIEQIFMNRGFAREDIYHYLNTTKNDVLDPKTIMHMREGAQMLVRHIQANEATFIQTDCDCDGYTSAALLINYLHRLFPAFVENKLKYRVQDGKEHGIIIKHIPEGTKLVIAPDSSSNDYEIHQQLKEQGIDVLVIDHHDAEKISEYACVINNQLCDYPTKSLSGVGMVYKFCCYIDELLGYNISDDYLDLVAVGLVGDMMDLRDFETKYLVTEGTARIRNPHIKLRCAANEYSIGPELTPFGISFYVAPFINAINRSGTFEEKMLVFESMLEYKAYDLIPSTKRGSKPGQTETRVEQAIRTSNNVKNRQRRAEEEAQEVIENLIQENKLLNNKLLIVTIPQEQKINSNIVGLVANQIANKYMRPTLILNETKINEKKYWSGSGRNFANSPILNLKGFLEETKFFNLIQGHNNAFGVNFEQTNLQKIIDLTNEKLNNIVFDATYLIDFSFNKNDISNLQKAILDIGSLKKQWGQGLEEPLILIKNIQITSNNLVLYEKGPTLKITIPNNNEISLMKFKSSEEEYNTLYTESGCVIINVIGTCEINSWNGNLKQQIIIKDYEIIGREAYYF